MPLMGGARAQPATFGLQVFDNVVVQPRDAREASDVFYRQKLGDVLLTYENEVVLTNEVYGPDKALPYTIPSPNVRIECPMALVDKVLEGRPATHQKAADDFARFCFTAEAQVEFGRVGFRTNPRLCKEQPVHLVSAYHCLDVDHAMLQWKGGWAPCLQCSDMFRRGTVSLLVVPV